MPNIDLDAIRRAVTKYAALKAKATEGEWVWLEGHAFSREGSDEPPCLYAVDPGIEVGLSMLPDDGRFCAAARNTPVEEWVEQLLDEVERLRGLCREAIPVASHLRAICRHKTISPEMNAGAQGEMEDQATALLAKL